MKSIIDYLIICLRGKVRSMQWIDIYDSLN